jgi:hydroxyacylglutathione hydrolase
VPTEVGFEKAINPFLRTHSPSIRARLGKEGATDVELFAIMRAMRDKL